MIQTLKHMGVRIWLTLLVAGPLVLWILPLFGPPESATRTLVPAAVIGALVFGFLGWAGNRIGRQAVERRTALAGELERAGNLEAAETTYRKAVALFDSFLLSPRARRRSAHPVAERVARFYLARADKTVESEGFIRSYLAARPDDREAAASWLRQFSGRGHLPEADQELAARIGNAQPGNLPLQRRLAQFYILDERTDFAALQTYRRVLAADKARSAPLTDRLASIFLREGRADEWALSIYLQAFHRSDADPDLIAGIGACTHWVEETDENRHLLAAGKRLLKDRDAAELAAMRRRFIPPAPAPTTSEPGVVRHAGAVADAAATAAAAMARALAAAGRTVADGIVAGLSRYRQSAGLRRAVAWGAILLGAVAAVALVVNTAQHVLTPEQPEVARPVAAAVPDAGKFTIQVAAYLTQAHAEAYMTQLRQKGVSAYWVQAQRRGKQWYQVRVSRFADKTAARTHAEKLKAAGVIDDFYIANYDPPQR